MLSALRNFALTFLISAIIFGILAYVIVGFVIDTMQETIPTGNELPSDSGTYNDTDYNDPHDTSWVTPSDTTDTTDSDTQGNDTDQPIEDQINGDTFNILLVGTDYQPEIFDDYDYEEKWEGPGFPDRRNRAWGADMIVLLRVDKEDRQFIFCPIPRNTRVLVDGTYTQLGDVLPEKGVDFLCGKISSLTGLNIDYYAEIAVGSIPEAIDAVGSVTYYIPEDMIYSDPDQNLEINLEEGKTEINGERAEQLLRYVGYEDGNVGRMNTTIGLCKALLDKFTDVSYLNKADDIYNAVKDHITTSFTLDDLLNNLDLIFSYSKFEKITVSYPGTNKIYDGVSYFEPSLTSALKMLGSYK